MAKNTLIDEFHLAVFARSGLRSEAYRAIRRTLDDTRFHTALRQAIRTVITRYPSLRKVRLTLTR
jgi:hypothetical protein